MQFDKFAEILDQEPHQTSLRRRKLLPSWVRFFVWVFLVLGVLAIFVLTGGLFGLYTSLYLYGIQSDEIYSISGVSVLVLYLLKGVSAYALWFEKDWAIAVARIDGILGVIICTLSMLLPVFGTAFGLRFGFRVELFALIPFLMFLDRIQIEWKKRKHKSSQSSTSIGH